MATMNPFEIRPEKPDSLFRARKDVIRTPCGATEVDPYTRVRTILAAGAEFEAVGFSHAFARHCIDNDLRRELALTRRIEQQQQKAIASLKPMDETVLMHTIGYEQLAVDLTAIMARNEPDEYVRASLDFALAEDFDHLYRYADLLDAEQNVRAELLTGGLTEIMPGRPTISEHRYPFDDVARAVPASLSAPETKLHTAIITAAEQQTMNYYMNVGADYDTEAGRRLYSEIAMIEEQHVSRYESLTDPSATWLEMLLNHEYAECYLYFSLYEDETDERVRTLWDRHLVDEISHLHKAADLLEKYEKKDRQKVIPVGKFPAPIAFTGCSGPNKEYIRGVLKNTENTAAILEDFTRISALPEDYEFFRYNERVNGSVASVASHRVISDYIAEFGEDYRFEEAPHPIARLRNRTRDNTTVGRKE